MALLKCCKLGRPPGYAFTRPWLGRRLSSSCNAQQPCEVPDNSWRKSWHVLVPFSSFHEVRLVTRIKDMLRVQEGLKWELRDPKTLGPLLGTAIEIRDVDVVQFLLGKGADPNGWSHVRSISHLAHATKHKDQKIMKALLDHGANPHGSGALWEAAERSNFRAAKLLLERGVDVNEVIPSWIYKNLNDREDLLRRTQLENFIAESHQGTALHAAASKYRKEMVRFLLGKGANKDIRNSQGQTAKDIVKLGRFSLPKPDVDYLATSELYHKILELLE